MTASDRPDRTGLQALLDAAAGAVERAFAPYSGVHVGAALEDDEGHIYVGCNVESASFGLTQCAERVALTTAVAAGARRFRRIVIRSSLDEPLMPCGACRQFLSEFAPELEVIVAGGGDEVVSASLAELLPHAFRPEDLPPRGPSASSGGREA